MSESQESSAFDFRLSICVFLLADGIEADTESQSMGWLEVSIQEVLSFGQSAGLLKTRVTTEPLTLHAPILCVGSRVLFWEACSLRQGVV